MSVEQDHISVKLACPDCGVPPRVDDEDDDSSIVYCPKCEKKFGTYGEVKAKALQAAKEKAVESLKGLFKNRKRTKR